MIRILIIDNEDVTHTHVRKLQEGVASAFEKSEPFVKFIHVTSEDSAILLAEVEELAKEHWDVIMIDVNLYPEKEGLPPLLVPCAVIDGFRRHNKTALAFVYSGLIEQHLEKVFLLREEVKSKAVEQHIRSILTLGIASFSAVNRVVDDVINSLHNLPPCLLIERELLVHKSRKVRGDVSQFADRTFAELAAEVRVQSRTGIEIVTQVTRHGVAAIVDLNR